jgi:hypothetical protein
VPLLAGNVRSAQLPASEIPDLLVLLKHTMVAQQSQGLRTPSGPLAEGMLCRLGLQAEVSLLLCGPKEAATGFL